MPFPTEHAARMAEPGQFVKFARQNDKFGPGVHAILGIDKGGKSVLQSIRFSVSKFSAAQSKRWLREHKMKSIRWEPAQRKALVLSGGMSDTRFKPTSFEPPTFVKDVMRVGHYEKKSDGWKLDVDTEKMDEWIAAFDAMAKDGVEVPLLKYHSFGEGDPHNADPEKRKSADAENTLGYIREMRREWIGDEDHLFVSIEFNSPDSADLAFKVGRTSPGIVSDYEGGNGKQYGEVIEHLALTPRPVVPGQQGFKIAASNRTAAGYITLTLNEETDMELQEFIKSLAKAFGLEDVTVDDALERFGEVFEKRGKDAEAQKRCLDDLLGEKKALADKLKLLEEGGKEKKLNPEVTDVLIEGAEIMADGLVGKGVLTPAVAAALKQVLVANDGTANIYCLSRSRSGTPLSIARAVFLALAKNDPVKLAEATKGQRIALSNPHTTDDKVERAKAVGNEIKGMIEAANFGFGKEN